MQIRVNRLELSLRHRDELDGEVESRAARNSGLGNTAVAVSEMGGNGQGSSLTLAHARNSLLVTLDDLKVREQRRSKNMFRSHSRPLFN